MVSSMTFALAIPLVLGAHAVARAELPILVRSHMGVGRLTSDARAHPDDAMEHTYGGWVVTAGMEAFAPLQSTRFGSAYGPHVRFDLSMYSPGVWSREDVATTSSPALLFMDVEVEGGVAVAPYYRPRFDVLVKLDGVVGTTRRGVQAGVETSLAIGRKRVMVDLALRTGHSWNGVLWREQRTRAGLRLTDAYLWLDIIAGNADDEMARIDYGTFARGDYLQGQLVLGWQLK